MSTEEFVKRVQKRHGNKFDLSQTKYRGIRLPVTARCKEHGDFTVSAHALLYRGGCKGCSAKSQRLTHEEFVKKASAVHSSKYSYDLFTYETGDQKVPIICPHHGVFYQRASTHLQGSGCWDCVGKKRLTTEDFVRRSKDVHGDIYDYSLVEYKNQRKRVVIKCTKHGEFTTTPEWHLQGGKCPRCSSTRLESAIQVFLDKNGIKYNYQHKEEWLRIKLPLSLDFYLPDYKIAIECQGEQHYKSAKLYGGQSGFVKRQKYDEIKQQLCHKHGIKVLYYTEPKFKEKYANNNKDTFVSTDELMLTINQLTHDK